MGKVGSRQDSEHVRIQNKKTILRNGFFICYTRKAQAKTRVFCYTHSMNWAERRKLTYALIILFIVGGVTFIAIRNAVSVEATCFDNKRNGGEVGIDCGGGCAMYCKNELPQPKVRWVRSFEMTPGVVHAVASIEHSNPGAAARLVRYQFKIYDDRNTLITERTGTTYIGPMGQSAIVESIIPVGNVKPSVTRLSFLDVVPWERISQTFSSVVIKADRTLLERYSGGTRLTATIENDSRFSFSKMEVVAILYNKDQNAITAAKIILPALLAEESETVYFTWPFALEEEVSRIEVIPRINPFTARSL